MTARSIELKNVHKAFGNPSGGSWRALKNITLTISEAEFVCLVGPSGCGKSSILNMVAGFDPPTQGEILHDGKPVTRPEPRRAMIFQDVQGSLFSWLTVRQNVEFGPRMRGVDTRNRTGTANRFIELVGLVEFADYFPHQLSGGMKQRVQIARALANDPEVLLMDEPFGALDAQTRSNLQLELERIWRETRKTVLFVTHDIAESVRLADRIVVLSKGPDARVLSTISVGLPRPRSAASPAFGELYREIEVLLQGAAPASSK